jgi:hypothetical protein
MKNRILLFLLLILSVAAMAQKKSKGKEKDKKQVVKNEIIDVGMTGEIPKPDSATRFTGIIKYKLTTDDPSDRDSMFIVFGENKIRVIMFTPGYKEGQIFENHFLASFTDSAFYIIDPRTKTYKLEKLGARNAAAQIDLANFKKTGLVLKNICMEYSGEMKVKEDVFEAAALISKQHSYLYALNYDFMNIQPVVRDYHIVLGWRTKSDDNENTYVIAYQVMPVEVSSFFDLTGYKQQ